jgi:hypothetical protein
MQHVDAARPVHAARSIALAGMLAGALDIVAAFIIYAPLGATPIRILQSIAAGLLGRDAFQGGTSAAALGLVLQFVIATGAAAAYYMASLRLPILLQRPSVCGTAFGVAVYIVMNFVVVPLSASPRGPFNWTLAPLIVLVHIVCVGLPIAWVISRRAASHP